MPVLRHQLIIIGAGPAGYEAAAHAAAQGRDVVLVERDLPGGTCLNRGCIPTKALCRSAEVMAEVADAAAFGIVASAPTVDYKAVVGRKDQVVTTLRSGIEMLLSKVTRIHGNARLRPATPADALLEDSASVVVEVTCADGSTVELQAPEIMIATGSQPAVLPIPGAELCVDSTAMLATDTLPKSLCVIGGGVIGMEFASIMRTFGVEVTVVEYCREILPPFDRDIAKRLRTALKQRGVEFVLQAEVRSVESTDEGLRVNYLCKGKEGSVTAERVLMATGRRPVIPEGCTECGIETSRRGISVDSQFQTSIAGVYAVGDCNGICQLAHAATAQALNVVGEKINCDVIPSAVFTVPECAMVGLTEEQCAERGLETKVTKSFYRANGKALAMGASDGLVKVITSAADGRILGVHIMGAHASDLIAEAALAISAGLTAADLRASVHAHPTLAELIPAAL